MGGAVEQSGSHPSDEDLIAFAGGETTGAAAAGVSAHLDQCPVCKGVVARVRLVGEVMHAPAPVEPPPALIARAKALFGTAADAPAARPDRLEPLRRIVAQLVFDSGAGQAPAMAGFRGGGDRHLTYVAEAVQIDLRVRPPHDQGGAWRVQGQVDAEKLIPAAAVDLAPVGEEGVVARATTDEYGMFDLAAPAGRYDLLIHLPCALQVLPGLVLG